MASIEVRGSQSGAGAFPIGQRVTLPGHFPEPVALEAVRPIGAGYECRVRLPDGSPDEAILSADEAELLFGQATTGAAKIAPADADRLRLLVESARIRLAYAHDRQFAVSLSGIRTLPHQIEAVYLKMLPQPRLRFLLADDPGAGKTIMAGLLIKEMKLREAIDRVLILCPAPLTIQWQDEMLRWFGETFDIIFSAVDQQQLVNPWQRATQVIASLDYAKQDDVRERVWQQHWDLVIIDEAHKCSAVHEAVGGPRRRGREDQALPTGRASSRRRPTTSVLLTATPHHGDDDRFAHFLRSDRSRPFPEPHRLGDTGSRDPPRHLPARRRLPVGAAPAQGRPARTWTASGCFPTATPHTVTFTLNAEEYALYKAVTAYINEFIPQASGRKQASVALARTVLQRRLASSTCAIHESLAAPARETAGPAGGTGGPAAGAARPPPRPAPGPT